MGKIIKLWSDIVEVKFDKQNLPLINQLLTTNNGKTFLLVKRIIDEQTVRAIIIYSSKEINIDDEVVNTNKVSWFLLVQIQK